VVVVVVINLAQKPGKTAGPVAVEELKTQDLQHLLAVLVTRHQLHHHKETTVEPDILGQPIMTKLAAVVVVLAQ
jgi:hypothetical protein